MKLQQLRYIWEVARHDLNVSATAEWLYTSQPGVSKQIRMLEDELGVQIFLRTGKQLTAVTPAGEAIIALAGRILAETDNIKRIAKEHSDHRRGSLSIATTHTQARYVLPGPVGELRRLYPKVDVSLHQGTPEQVAQMLLDHSADVGLATESLSSFDGLVTLPCYKWQHVIVVPEGHALARSPAKLTLKALAAHPLVSYQPAFAGRRRVDEAFAAAGITPRVALEAIDSDVIKTYVRSGLGVGVVAEMAVREPGALDGLVSRPAGHLFGTNTTRVAFRRGVFLRHYVHTLVNLLAPALTSEVIDAAMSQAAGGAPVETA